jgi:hypothetical protein
MKAFARSIKATCPWCRIVHKARITPGGRTLYFCPTPKPGEVTIRKGSNLPVVEIGRVEPRASKENATALSASLGGKAFFPQLAN